MRRTRNKVHPPVENEPKGATPRRQSDRNQEAFLVGKAAKMPNIQLPTRADVIKHFLYLKGKEGKFSGNQRLYSCPLDGFR